MKKLILASILPFVLFSGALAQDAVSSLEDLLRQVREQGGQTASQNKQREQEFRQKRNEQKAILDRTRAELRQEEAGTDTQHHVQPAGPLPEFFY